MLSDDDDDDEIGPWLLCNVNRKS